MAWGRLDDGLHKSVKWRRATKGARALWTTAFSWCLDELTDGFVPDDMLRVLDGTKKEAQTLVDVGLWETRKHGWKFHDWHDYNPDAASIKAAKAKESAGAALGNHRRWHTGRSIVVPGCEYCDGLPPESDIEPPIGDLEQDEIASGTRSGTRGGTRIGGESPEPEPNTRSTQVGGGGYLGTAQASEPPPPPTAEILDKLQEPWRCPDHQGIDMSCHHCKAYKVTHKQLETDRTKQAKDDARRAEQERKARERAGTDIQPATPEEIAKAKEIFKRAKEAKS